MHDSVLESIVSKYNTPIYIYNGNGIVENYTEMKYLLDEDIDIFLSLKANPTLGIANLFSKLGAGVEVASIGELKTALVAGFLPKDIIFSGPGKSEKELEYAINNDIYCIIAESLREIQIISKLANLKNSKIRIALRVNPNFTNENSTTLKMGGIASQFGIEEIEIEKCVNYILSEPNIEMIGIHTYTGTQVLDYRKVLSSIEYTLELADYLIMKYDLKIQMIDVGGGLGVNYFPHEQEFDFKEFANELNKILTTHKLRNTGVRYIIESGRYLLAKYGYYITKVKYIKISRGVKFVIVDGGLHHHQASTFRGRIMRNNFPIKILGENDSSTKESVTVVGPLCTPEDCIAKGIELNKVKIGDYICIEKSGAYGLTYSPVLFLSHPTPIEVLNYNGKNYIIRASIDISTILNAQNTLPNEDFHDVLK